VTGNPFRPPEAEVADAGPGLGPMPRGVRLACTLVLLSLVVGAVTLLPGVRPEPPGAEPVPFLFTLAVLLVFGGLTVWLVKVVERGRNWGRWALLAYLALGWWLGIDQITEDFALSPLVGFVDMGCIVVEMVAAVLLFWGAAGRWFR